MVPRAPPVTRGKAVTARVKIHADSHVPRATNGARNRERARATNAPATVPGNSFDLWIGGAPDYPVGRTFNGVADECAVLNSPLAAPQIRQIYYGALPPPDITLTLNRVGNQFQLIWGRGFLQSADNVTGPYVDVPGAPLSPYTINPSGISKFFRARE